MMINIENIKRKLKSKIIGKNIIFFEEIDSTQIKAKELAEKNIENGTIVITENQTNGLGTHGRNWYSEKNKNLTFTMIMYPKCSINELDGITKKIAEYMTSAIYNVCNARTDIKEPNDIMLNNKKIGGILTQIITKGEKIRYLLIGIGIDVNGTDFPEELDEIATSLKKELKKEYQREDILLDFCDLFENYCIEKKII